MKIAYDLDDTMFDAVSSILPYFNKKFVRALTFSNVYDMILSGTIKSSNYLCDAYGIEDYEIDKIFYNESEFILPNERLLIGTATSAKLEAVKGNEIYYITARDEKQRSLTEAQIKRSNLPDGKIIMTREKGEAAFSLGIDRFYEDSISNIVDLRYHNIECVMVEALNNLVSELEDITTVPWNDKLNLLMGRTLTWRRA